MMRYERFATNEWGEVDSLRDPSRPSIYIRDPDGDWWDLLNFPSNTVAFSASHKAAELDAALAELKAVTRG